MQQPYYSSLGCTRALPTSGIAVVWLCGLLGLLAPASASTPTLESLQQEWHQIFPATFKPLVPPLRPPPADGSPFSIAEKHFLLGWPLLSSLPSGSTSLLRIRNYPPPIRQAHAACVKIITPYWHGAGIMISASGDVLTSYHLVAGAPSVSVQMLDGRLLATTNVTAFSARHDLALLHVEGGPFTFLPANRVAPPASGEHLSIVGHPGELSWKLDPGSVIRLTSESGTEVLHFNADIGQGNSGGPIVDEAGQLCALTACAATLKDGSKVKVGISAKAIQDFLSSPRNPAALAEMAIGEKNRRTAELLQGLCLLTRDWMREWLNAMSQVTLTPAKPDANPLGERRVAVLNMERATEASLKFLLLKTVMAYCLDLSTPDPALIARGTELTGTLDRLLDCTRLLGEANGRTPADVQRVLGQIRNSRTQATLHFSRAVYGLEQAGDALEWEQVNPPVLRLETLRDLYAPPSRYFETSRSEGRS